MQVTLVTLLGQKFTFEVDADMTIGDLKKQVKSLPADCMNFVYGNNTGLTDDAKTLADYKIPDGAEIIVVMKKVSIGFY